MDPKQLREQTRSEHESTEALMSLGHSGLTPQEYAKALLALFPVVDSWERWAGDWAPPSLQSLVRERRRGDLLRADLEALKASQETTRTGHTNWVSVVTGTDQVPLETFRANDPAAFAAGFLGALYVVEGSTLGGRFLARHVASELGAGYEGATRYFNGYGERTGAMWRQVTGCLEEVPDKLAETTVAAAKRTFGVFADALRA